eukprot:1181761-Prorocentrum_minimum.AAC.2
MNNSRWRRLRPPWEAVCLSILYAQATCAKYRRRDGAHQASDLSTLRLDSSFHKSSKSLP